MIKLSEEPKRLVSAFLRYRNTIDIYTEDNDKDKEFYKVLFKRLLKNDIIINDINPLGSKSEVINRCKHEPENGRKKIFIIDGDVLIIHGKDIPEMKNLYVLDAYCIENFLFDKETIVNFIYLNCAEKPKETIEAELRYDEWIKGYSEKLIELFIHFAITNFFGGCFQLSNAYKYHKIIDGRNVFSEDIVNADIQKLIEGILELTSENEYKRKLLELKNQWSISIDNLFTIVSGKDFLIPILLIKTTYFKKSKSKPTLEELKFSLVQYSNLERLSLLKETIEAL